MSPLTWVVCAAVVVFVAWFGWELHIAPLMPDDYDTEPRSEPVWGCDCCQDEAEEIAVLEAMWEAS